MAASENQELVGIAQVQAQLLLSNQTSSASSSNISLDELLVFKEASFTENVFTGKAEYTLTYASSSLDFVDRVLKACELSGTPEIRLRYGYGHGSSTIWLPWQKGIIKQATSVPADIGQTAGHNVMLVIGNALYTMGRASKTNVRKGLISDIVGQIASENSLDAVIEPTQNEFAYIQSFIADTAFIIERLQPRATNANGRGNYLFYVRDNVLHFHTPDYQGSYSELNYYGIPHTAMGQNSLGQLLYGQGVSGVRLIAYDPYTAQSRELLSDPEKALRLADTLPAFDSVDSGELNLSYHLSENRPEESVNLGQNAYERARMSAYNTSFSVQKIANIRAGDFLNLIVSPTNSKTSAWSGVYLIIETTYLVKEGSITGSITVTRGEIASTIGQATTQNPNDELVSETEAPGHKLNLSELQDSNKTKGAGTDSSTTNYATVQSPD